MFFAPLKSGQEDCNFSLHLLTKPNPIFAIWKLHANLPKELDKQMSFKTDKVFKNMQ